jgi:hypothetical protein
LAKDRNVIQLRISGEMLDKTIETIKGAFKEAVLSVSQEIENRYDPGHRVYVELDSKRVNDYGSQ